MRGEDVEKKVNRVEGSRRHPVYWCRALGACGRAALPNLTSGRYKITSQMGNFCAKIWFLGCVQGVEFGVRGF